MPHRHLRLPLVTLLVLLAACGREALPIVATAAPAPPRASVTRPAVPVPRPVWAARKVIADGAAVAGGTTLVGVGETLDGVAARTRIPAGALAAANGLSVSHVAIATGQVLKLPNGRVHTVHPGETGIAIARAYGVDWARVVATNRLAAPFTLEIGDRLLLPSARQVAAMSVEERARAFRIDIDDLITGAEPAASPDRAPARTAPPRRAPPAAVAWKPPAAAVASASRPLPVLTGPAPKFDWPLDGRIVSGFGAKPGGRFNDGVNLAAVGGEAVRAAGDGVVAYAGDAVAGFGNLVLIKHADGWVSAYGHNSALLVARGARVARGEVIARAGATGSVGEPQLHFELRHGRTAIDPAKILPARG